MISRCTPATPSEPADAPASDSANDEPNPSSEAEAPPEPEVQPVTEGPELALRTLHFPEAELDLKILDQPHATHAWDRGGVLSQTVRFDRDSLLRVVVRVGEGESLDPIPEFRPSTNFDAPRRTELCGRPARLLVGHSPERIIECIEFADGTPSRPGFDPAQTTLILGFEHEGLGVTAEWSVPTAYRELYRPLEDEFFASLGCPKD